MLDITLLRKDLDGVIARLETRKKPQLSGSARAFFADGFIVVGDTASARLGKCRLCRAMAVACHACTTAWHQTNTVTHHHTGGGTGANGPARPPPGRCTRPAHASIYRRECRYTHSRHTTRVVGTAIGHGMPQAHCISGAKSALVAVNAGAFGSGLRRSMGARCTVGQQLARSSARPVLGRDAAHQPVAGQQPCCTHKAASLEGIAGHS